MEPWEMTLDEFTSSQPYDEDGQEELALYRQAIERAEAYKLDIELHGPSRYRRTPPGFTQFEMAQNEVEIALNEERAAQRRVYYRHCARCKTRYIQLVSEAVKAGHDVPYHAREWIY